MTLVVEDQDEERRRDDGDEGALSQVAEGHGGAANRNYWRGAREAGGRVATAQTSDDSWAEVRPKRRM